MLADFSVSAFYLSTSPQKEGGEDDDDDVGCGGGGGDSNRPDSLFSIRSIFASALLVGQLVVCFFAKLFAPTTATATVWLDLNIGIIFSAPSSSSSALPLVCLADLSAFVCFSFTDVHWCGLCLGRRKKKCSLLSVAVYLILAHFFLLSPPALYVLISYFLLLRLLLLPLTSVYHPFRWELWFVVCGRASNHSLTHFVAHFCICVCVCVCKVSSAWFCYYLLHLFTCFLWH